MSSYDTTTTGNIDTVGNDPGPVMPPHVAAVVQYTQRAGGDHKERLAAIITGFPHDEHADPSHVHLVVFATQGFFFANRVPHDPDGDTDGSWQWSPQFQAATVPAWFHANGVVDTDPYQPSPVPRDAAVSNS